MELTGNKIPISVLIFTMDEEINLPHCLNSLSWCDDIIVIDSFSSDQTENIARQSGARFYQNEFDGFGTQRNWALENIEIKYKWALVLDADERVTDELVEEMNSIVLSNPDETGAYRIKRRFFMWGHWLRYSSLYPTWVVRFIHIDRVRFINRGHAETQEVDGETGELKNDLIDENLKGIHEWFTRQNQYSLKEAEYEIMEETNPVNFSNLFSKDPLDRRIVLKRITYRMPLRPLIFFLYSYIWRRGFLDGYDGLVFCLMKSLYQRMIIVKKYNIRRLEKKG